MNSLTVVDIKIPSTNTMYKRTRHGVFLTKEAKDFKKALNLLAKSTRPILIKGDCRVKLVFTSKSNRRLDIDNGLKLTLDALEGAFYENDKQIIELIVQKRLGDRNMLKINVGML